MKIAHQICLMLVALCLAHQTAAAADLPEASIRQPIPPEFLPFFVHFGPAGIILSEGAKVTLLGGL